MVLSLTRALEILLAAQAAYASIAGTVRDAESGEPLSGAVVTLPDLDRYAVTDAEGRYRFGDVPPGPQHVAVQRVGYASRTLHALVPRQGDVEIHVTLRREPIELGAIEVRLRIPVRGIEGDAVALSPDRSVSAAAVRHSPLLSEPDFFQALGGGGIVMRPESPSGIHVRSGASDQTTYFLDGIPVFSPYHAAGTFSAWNPDALARSSLSVVEPRVGFADALSGIVSAETRAPGASLTTQGSLSTTQARVTVDGPLGPGGAGYLVSARAGFPGFIVPRREGSYLRSETSDALAKVEIPLAGGRVRLLGYDSRNDIGASASATEGSDEEPARNAFSWRSRSLGGEWTRRVGTGELRLRAWRATADAGSDWRDEDGAPERMTAERRDEGGIATMEFLRPGRTTLVGIEARKSRTSYRVAPGSDPGDAFALEARTPAAAAFVHHAGPIAPRARIELGLTAARGAGRLHLDPSARLRWEPASSLSVSGTYARTHQLEQSLRNPESVVGNVFPADLHVGVGAEGVPVARGDQGILAFDYRPAAGIRLEAEAYERDLRGLLLVAPASADPFATGGFVVGSARGRGVSFGAALSAARYAAIASYGFQHARYEYGDTLFTPDHGAAHVVDVGVIVYPTVTSSLSLGTMGVLGRTTTAVSGLFEWEACNLLDQGCEFAGSPQTRAEPLGATTLPAYLRVDVGLRKHWHVKVGRREGRLTAFGTLTNILGRENLLTVTEDLATGEETGVTMRPRAPLVVGLDWQI